MRNEGTPSRRAVFKEGIQRQNPVYPDKPLRDVLGPMPSRPVLKDDSYKLRDPDGRVIRALSGIMMKGNRFKGTF